MRSYIRRVREDEAFAWKLLLAAAFVGTAAGTCVVLGGLASLTNFCLENQPLGIGKGMKMEAPLTALTAQVMSIQRATVTNPDGSFNCGHFFRLDWTLWAMQVVFLALFGVVWWSRCIRRFLPGLTALGAVLTVWHMYKTNYIVEMEPWTKGELHTSGFVTAFGLIACCIGNLCLLFFSGPYSERERGQRVAAISTGPSAHTLPKGASFDESSEDVHSSHRDEAVPSAVHAAHNAV